MLTENNRIYNNQFSVMVFIASLTFKVVMLPKYMSEVAGSMAFVSVAIMMALEVVGFLLVSYIIRRINLLKVDSKLVMIPLMLSLFALSGMRSIVLGSEALTYINGTVFDQWRIAFVLLALTLFIGYIVHKGGNTLARLSQILIWFIIAGIGFAIVFVRVDMNFNQLLPMFDDGIMPILKGCNDHYFWFGDYMPFLFMSIVPRRDRAVKSRRNTLPLLLLVIFCSVVFFYMLFTAVYGDACGLVKFAFNRMAIFNKISTLIGPTNFPAVITWLLMAIVKLSVLFYATTMALTYFVRRKSVALAINMVLFVLILGFAVPSVEKSYSFGAGGAKYFAAAAQYLVPVLLAIYVKVKTKGSTVSNALSAEGLLQPSDKIKGEASGDNSNAQVQ